MPVRGEEPSDTLIEKAKLATQQTAFIRETLRLRRDGDYAGAAKEAERWVAAMEAGHGKDSPSVASALEMLGMMRKETDEGVEAEAALLRALAIRTTEGDPKNTATCQRHLADLYKAKGAFGKAKEMLEAALAGMTTAQGAEDSGTIGIENSLGILLMELGDYDTAERHLRRVVEVGRRDGADAGVSTLNLAVLYTTMGSHAQAVTLLKEAVPLIEGKKGASHPDTLQAKALLGTALAHAGQRSEGINILTTVVAELESSAPSSGALASALNNLASAHASDNGWKKATPLFERALGILIKLFGEKHPNAITTLDNLGYVMLRSGDAEGAKPLLEKAHALARDVYPARHPSLANHLEKRVWAEHALGHDALALELCLAARAIRDHDLAGILSFASESQRLAYLSSGVGPFSHLATLGAAEPLADTVIRLKGIVLDSLLEDQRLSASATDPESLEATRALADARQAWFDAGNDTTLRGAREREIEKLETQLARNFSRLGAPRRALRITAAEVSATLPPDGALVEYIRYDHYLPTGGAESRYGAVVITRDRPAVWVGLDACAKVDPLIDTYASSVLGRTDEETLHDTLRGLHDQLWQPVAATLPTGTQRAVISPDGKLNALSFATFLDKADQFLAASVELCYTATGRDLLQDTGPLPDSPSMLVLANPAFSKTAPPALITDAGEFRNIRTLGDLSLPPLPGTEEEARLLTETARKAKLKEFDVLVGEEATEDALRALPAAPAILHLATHGFFPDTLDASSNPMYSSGLALAGATSTLAAWKVNRTPDSRSDGILTAAEIGTLPLEDTWLLALSACGTGLGEAVAGEGILGLRRGIAQATRAHQLLTLWSIGDHATPDLMDAFYHRVFSGVHPGSALWQVQREQLAAIRKTNGLLRAVQDAGPFVIAISGKPPAS